MSKVTIAVLEGVAAVYPYGVSHEATPPMILGEGESVECVVGPHPEPYAETKQSAADKARAAAEADKVAPAAGVAIDEPVTKRAGTLQVEVLEGTVTVRRYEGSNFVEQLAQTGDKVSMPVTESNRLTLAVYEAKAQPK